MKVPLCVYFFLFAKKTFILLVFLLFFFLELEAGHLRDIACTFFCGNAAQLTEKFAEGAQHTIIQSLCYLNHNDST